MCNHKTPPWAQSCGRDRQDAESLHSIVKSIVSVAFLRLEVIVACAHSSCQASLSTAMVWSKLSQTEIDLAKRWHIEDGESVGVIAKRLGRDFSTMSRLLVQRKTRKAQGRPQTLTTGKVDQLEKKVGGELPSAWRHGRHVAPCQRMRRHARIRSSGAHAAQQ